jgi:hypothetical protein
MDGNCDGDCGLNVEEFVEWKSRNVEACGVNVELCGVKVE